FPVENRRIMFAPVANVTAKATDEDKARPLLALNRIGQRHPGRRLLHTVSSPRPDPLTRTTKPDRTVFTYRNANEKAKALAEYLRTPGAVMFAPSMDRGVDLKGDACECQIIAKCPFPYLGDKRISARLRLPNGQTWYTVKTIRDIVQMTGRGV